MENNEEYLEMFFDEAQGSAEELNKHLSNLEKNNEDRKLIDSIFRIAHTIKGNAMGLGIIPVGELMHVFEDVIGNVKSGAIKLTPELFNSLFTAIDKLTQMVEGVKSDKKVSYKGIQTKLKIYLENELMYNTMNEANSSEEETNDDTSNEDSESDIELDPIESIISDDEEEEEEEEEEDSDDEEQAISFSELVKVPIRKLDNLLNLVGELVIERDRLISLSDGNAQMKNNYSRLVRITSDMQYGIMDVRLVQIGFLFNKFHRIIRDVSVIESKNVNLKLEGTAIEIDRNILEIMSDSMIHLVRNAVSHGIESPENRAKVGKSNDGEVTLRARNDKDTVYIDISDNGKGIDPEIIRKKVVEKNIYTKELANNMKDSELIMAIFEPGFSSVDKITEVSGRGVGMDVVKRATESIGGNVSVESVLNEGTTITMALPSSMAVKGALLFEVKQQEFAIPLTFTEAVISLYKDDIHKVSNGLVAKYLGNSISIVFLQDLFNSTKGSDQVPNNSFEELETTKKLDIVIVSHANRYVGFVVDKLLQQKEIVEKSLQRPLDKIYFLSGATILGNGNVCLVMDVPAILNRLFKSINKSVLQ